MIMRCSIIFPILETIAFMGVLKILTVNGDFVNAMKNIKNSKESVTSK